LRSPVTLGLLVVAAVFAGFVWRHRSTPDQPHLPARPVIEKQPVVFAQRFFDPATPPSEMPRLGEGEEAECDSNFLSDASVSGRMQKLDKSSATVTISQVRVTLELKITIWVPNGATQHVVEHEEGHRQISEHYYRFADRVAAEIGAPYIGRQIAIRGADLDAELERTLRGLSKAITEEYNSKLSPGPAQQRYDELTDHSRNDRDSKEAAAQALKEAM